MFIFGLILVLVTIVLTYGIAPFGSKRWYLVALATGWFGGFFMTIFSDFSGSAPDIYAGVLSGIFVDIFVVGGGVLTRYYRNQAIKWFQKSHKK